MLRRLFRKKINDGESAIDDDQESVYSTHADKDMNWTFDETIDPKTIFTKLKVIGKGGFGTVAQIIYRPTMKILAGKIIDQALIDNNNTKEDIQHEVDLLKEVDSIYTVHYYGCVNFEGSLMILMEYIDRGSLRNILDSREQVLSEDQISCVISDLLNGLKKIHNDFHLLHRDIKAANLLLNSKGNIKIGDFGVSRQFDRGKSTSSLTIVGTPYWMAPEVINGLSYSYSADIWSVGITAVELAEGSPPYVEYSPTKAMVEIATKGFPGYRFPNMHSPEFTDFVSHCVCSEPEQRWTVDQLLNHPFILRSQNYSRKAIMKDMIHEGATNYALSSESLSLSHTVSTFDSQQLLSGSKLTNSDGFSGSRSQFSLDINTYNNFQDCAKAIMEQQKASNQILPANETSVLPDQVETQYEDNEIKEPSMKVELDANGDKYLVKEDIKNGLPIEKVVLYESNEPTPRHMVTFEQKDADTFLISDVVNKQNRVLKSHENDESKKGLALSQIDNKQFMQISRAMSKKIPFHPMTIATNQDAPVEMLYVPVDVTMMKKKILPPLIDEDGVINFDAAVRHDNATIIVAIALILISFVFFGPNGFFFLLGVAILTHMIVLFMQKRKERHEMVVKKAKDARMERNRKKVEALQQKKKEKRR